jgi:hypothetical protein
MANLSELKEVVAFMRENGVLQYDGIVLAPETPRAVDNPMESVESPKVVKKLGSDGLTAIQQWEHYGRVIDAEE